LLQSLAERSVDHTDQWQDLGQRQAQLLRVSPGVNGFESCCIPLSTGVQHTALMEVQREECLSPQFFQSAVTIGVHRNECE
jgi:hypothetical protein